MISMSSVCIAGLVSIALLAQPAISDDLIAFGFDGFHPGINRSFSASDTKEKLLQRFGKPRTLEMRKQLDRDPTVLHIEVYTWQWEGLEIITARPILYEGYDKPTQWIEKIILTSPKYKLKFDLSIGAHRKAFIEALGQPPSQGPKAMGYWDHSSGPVVNIWFDEQDRAKRITWQYGY